MSKIKKVVPVNYNLHDWKYHVTISKIREDLDEIEKLGATHVVIQEWDDTVHIEPFQERLETDEEYASRLALEERVAQEQERNQRAYYEKLKAKYEGNSEPQKLEKPWIQSHTQ